MLLADLLFLFSIACTSILAHNEVLASLQVRFPLLTPLQRSSSAKHYEKFNILEKQNRALASSENFRSLITAKSSPDNHSDLLDSAKPVKHHRTERSLQSPEQVKQTLDQICFNCLCQTSPKCEKKECHEPEPDKLFCGPYLISVDYWKDSGEPGKNPNDPHAFEKCVNDMDCAERTILGYMTRYATDCNDDGLFDCQDVVLIHKTGAEDCNSSSITTTQYWKRFIECWEEDFE